MEVRRVADTVLRCQSATLATLLAPAWIPTVRWPTGRQLASREAHSISQRRTFITTMPKYASSPSRRAVTSPAPSRDDNEASKEKESASTPADSTARDLGWIQGGISRSTSSQQGEEKNSLSRQREVYMNRGSSADDIMKSMNSAFPSSSRSSTGGIDLSRMKNPSAKSRSESTTDMMNAITTLLPKQEKIPIRLSPTTGRTITVQGTVDVARGFKLLDRTIAVNKVRKQSVQQRYHERRGIKKKRLRRERWRAKFMEGFKATVSRVKMLKNQGW